jgi:hypothetical protein
MAARQWQVIEISISAVRLVALPGGARENRRNLPCSRRRHHRKAVIEAGNFPALAIIWAFPI